jgi:hypothetical protein
LFLKYNKINKEKEIFKIMSKNYHCEIPKCPEDGKTTTSRTIYGSIKGEDASYGRGYPYCSKCRGYLVKGKIEKDKKKILLNYINESWGKNLSIDDLVEVKVTK